LNGTVVVEAKSASVMYTGSQTFVYDTVRALNVIIRNTDLGGLENISEQRVKLAIENANDITLH
jgi:hypothetical protein